MPHLISAVSNVVGEVVSLIHILRSIERKEVSERERERERKRDKERERKRDKERERGREEMIEIEK